MFYSSRMLNSKASGGVDDLNEQRIAKESLLTMFFSNIIHPSKEIETVDDLKKQNIAKE